MTPKTGLNLERKYSINFDLPERDKKLIKFIIIHYTGMKIESKAIERLVNPKSKEFFSKFSIELKFLALKSTPEVTFEL